MVFEKIDSINILTPSDLKINNRKGALSLLGITGGLSKLPGMGPGYFQGAVRIDRTPIMTYKSGFDRVCCVKCFVFGLGVGISGLSYKRLKSRVYFLDLFFCPAVENPNRRHRCRPAENGGDICVS